MGVSGLLAAALSLTASAQRAGVDSALGLPTPPDAPGESTTLGVQTGELPQAVALWDRDRDGDMDAVVANGFADSVTILDGDGFGGLIPQATLAVGPNPGAADDLPRDLAIADIDGDCLPDLLVVNSGFPGFTSPSLAVCRGRPDGGFDTPWFQSLGAGVEASHTIALGQLDSDEPIDLVVGNRFSNDVTVLLGERDGSFDPPQITPVPSGSDGSLALAIADLDLDGNGDLIVANRSEIVILPGVGDGTFQSPVQVVSGSALEDAALTDLDGDSLWDLVIVDNDVDQVSALMGLDISGSFVSRVDSPTPGHTGPVELVIDDFDLDAVLDVAVAHFDSATISIWLGDGTGAFPTLWDSAASGLEPVDLKSGHLTPEGAPDLISANQGDQGAPANDDISTLINAAVPAPGPALTPLDGVDIAAQAGPAICRAPGLGVDSSSGDIWLCDPLMGELVRVDASGLRLGVLDTAAVGILDPQDVAVDPATGNLWVADGIGDSVFEITPSGSVVRSFPAPDPTGIAADLTNSRLLVSHLGSDQISAYDIAGMLTGAYELNSPVIDLTRDSTTGNLWVTETEKDELVELLLDDVDDEAEEVSRIKIDNLAEILHSSDGLAVGFDPSDRRLIFTTTRHALAVAAETSPGAWEAVSLIAHDVGLHPRGLAVDEAGTIVIADPGLRGEMLFADTSLNLLSSLALVPSDEQPDTQWADVAIANGELFAIDSESDDVRVFSLSGTEIRSFEILAMENRRPSAIAHHEGRGTLFLLAERILLEVTDSGAVVASHPMDATFSGGALDVEPLTGELVILSGRHRRVIRMNPDGQVVARLTASPSIPPSAEPVGLAIHPITSDWIITTNRPGELLANQFIVGITAVRSFSRYR